MTDRYEDLIGRLHDALWSDPGTELLFTEAAAAISALVKERGEARNVCAEAYQYAGCVDAPVEVLDNLSDAANGAPLRHPEGFLPILQSMDQTNYQRGLRDGERKGLEKAAKWHREWVDELMPKLDTHIPETEIGRQLVQQIQLHNNSAGHFEALITQEQSDTQPKRCGRLVCGLREVKTEPPMNPPLMVCDQYDCDRAARAYGEQSDDDRDR